MTTIATGRADTVSSAETTTLAWALKRTALAVCIFAVTVTGAALLMHAAIEPEPRIDLVPASAQQALREYQPSL